MIEVRSFDGDPDELVALINCAWQERYLSKDLIPVYDRAGLEWQILQSKEGSHPFHLAAYDGAKLVGCFLAERLSFQVEGETVPGTQGSWFSVLPEYASSRVAIRLINALERAHREHEMRLFLGYVNHTQGTSAKVFWDAYAHAFPQRYRSICDVHFWTRFLRHGDVADRLSSGLERAGVRLLSMVQGIPRVGGGSGPTIRPFEGGDLDGCLALLNAHAFTRGLGQVWDAPTLIRQLTDPHHTPPVATTLVVEGEGGIQGLANAFSWPMKGSGTFPAAVVDLMVADGLPPRDQRRLLTATTAALAAQGAALVMAPAYSFDRKGLFAGAGFVPLPSVCTLMTLFPDPALSFDPSPAQLRFR